MTDKSQCSNPTLEIIDDDSFVRILADKKGIRKLISILMEAYTGYKAYNEYYFSTAEGVSFVVEVICTEDKNYMKFLMDKNLSSCGE